MSETIGGPRAWPFHVMAKPTGPRCNLDCTYCYYLEKQTLYPDEHKFRMPLDVLETFIRDYIASQVKAGQQEIWFAWQGGEPTMLGLGYFRTILELQRKHAAAGVAIHNALQTNGTLLDEKWARFLHEERFLVGLSLDGPPHLHDHYRRDRRDLPSSPRVLAAWDLLNRHRVETNVLCVVNRRNAAAALEIYRYLRELGVRFMQFIPVVERIGRNGVLAGPPGPHDKDYSIAPWSVRPRDYGRFLCTIFDEWVRHDVGRIFVQLFDVQLGIWMGQPAGLCVFAETCGAGLALEHNGDLYACDHLRQTALQDAFFYTCRGRPGRLSKFLEKATQMAFLRNKGAPVADLTVEHLAEAFDMSLLGESQMLGVNPFAVAGPLPVIPLSIDQEGGGETGLFRSERNSPSKAARISKRPK